MLELLGMLVVFGLLKMGYETISEGVDDAKEGGCLGCFGFVFCVLAGLGLILTAFGLVFH